MDNVSNSAGMQRNALDKHMVLVLPPLPTETIHSPKYKLARLKYTRVLHVCWRVSDLQHTNVCI
jgi:hypothetical protein